MVPIYEQGMGKGIGHTFESLTKRFIDICNDHLQNGRAKAFAFLLYDFHDEQIKKILKSHGGFARLDRLSGDQLSLFYLHSKNKKLLHAFNEVFMRAFEVQSAEVNLPLVLFFKVSNNEVVDVEIVELERSELMFAFNELYEILESYIGNIRIDSHPTVGKINRVRQLAKKAQKLIVEKIIEIVLTKGAEYTDIY
jgi:hypothetical protein